MVPDELDLLALRGIWCRSLAELETLRSLLPSAIWVTHSAHIGSGARPNLFFCRWTYLDRVDLADDRLHFHFNPSTQAPGPFVARLEFSAAGARFATWVDDAFSVSKYGKPADLTIAFPRLRSTYSVQLFLDDALAYAGTHTSEEEAALF